MGFFSRFKRKKRYKFNKGQSYDTRCSYYGNGNFKNPIVYRKKKKSKLCQSF